MDSDPHTVRRRMEDDPETVNQWRTRMLLHGAFVSVFLAGFVIAVFLTDLGVPLARVVAGEIEYLMALNFLLLFIVVPFCFSARRYFLWKAYLCSPITAGFTLDDLERSAPAKGPVEGLTRDAARFHRRAHTFKQAPLAFFAYCLLYGIVQQLVS